MFSFYSDDSFDPLDCGPDMCTIKKKPFIVPSLNLHNLPEYETSSEEGEEEGEGQEEEETKNMSNQEYQKSIKYIENYYN